MSDKFRAGLKAGSTSVSIPILVRKTSDNTGATAIAYNTGGNIASYWRQGGVRVAITLATQTVNGAYSSGGFVEVDATNQKGVYRLDVPDAAFATGADWVVISFLSTSNYEVHLLFPLEAAATVAQEIWDALTSALTTSSSIGKKLADLPVGSDGRVKVSADAHSSGETVAAVTGAVGSVTGNVGGNVTGSVGSVASGGIGAAAFAANAIADAAVAADMDVYTAQVSLEKDSVEGKDEWTVIWRKNGQPVATGYTGSAQIQVVKRVDGTDLVAATNMTQIGSSAAWKYSDATNRVSPGEPVIAWITATIDGSARMDGAVVSRDA